MSAPDYRPRWRAADIAPHAGPIKPAYWKRIQRYFAHTLPQQYAPSTAELERRHYLAAHRYLRADRLAGCTVDPEAAEEIAAVKRAAVRARNAHVIQRKVRIVTAEEIPKLLEACTAKGQWCSLAVRAALETGWRLGTVCAFDRQWITGRAADSYVIDVPASAMKCREGIRSYLPLDFPVDQLYNGKWKRRKLQAAFGNAVRTAQLACPLPTFHDLRKTWLDRMVTAGMPWQTIAALGAWKTPAIVMKHYATKTVQAETVERFRTIVKETYGLRKDS